MEIYKNLFIDNLEGEEWANTCHKEYLVSSLGRVKTLKRGGGCGDSDKILRQYLTVYGYLIVSFVTKGEEVKKRVHRLVAEAFIPNPENKKTVNHKNGIKTDNRATELEWATYSEQGYHRYRVLKQTPPPGLRGRLGSKHHLSKKVLCITNGQTYGSAREAARELKLWQTNVSNVCRGGYNQTGGYIFRYI